MSSPLQIATSISAALTIGMVPVLFRTIQHPLEQRLRFTAGRLDRLHKFLILSWVPLMPLAGWLVDHWGIHKTLFTGSLVLGLAIAWLAVSQNYPSLFWGVLGLGFAGACITMAGIAFMPSALISLGGMPRGASAGVSLCLGFVFVGLASLVTPLLFPWLLGKMDLRRSVLVLGLLCLLPAALVALVKSEPNLALAASPDSSPYDIRFWLLALVAFMYFPLEYALEIWPRPYLTEIGYTGQTIPRLLVGFWFAFLLMRLGLGWIIRPGNEAWLMLILLVLSSVVLGNLAGAYAPSSGSLGFWLLGACFGPLLPILLGILLDLEGPRGNAGQALGVVFALGAVGCLVIRPLLVAYAKNHSPRACMRIAMVLGLLMAAPLLVLTLIRFGR